MELVIVSLVLVVVVVTNVRPTSGVIPTFNAKSATATLSVQPVHSVTVRPELASVTRVLVGKSVTSVTEATSETHPAAHLVASALTTGMQFWMD